MKNILKLSLFLALGSLQQQTYGTHLITLQPGGNYEIGTVSNRAVRSTNGQIFSYSIGKKSDGVHARIIKRTSKTSNSMGSTTQTTYTLHVGRLSKAGTVEIMKDIYQDDNDHLVSKPFQTIAVITK